MSRTSCTALAVFAALACSSPSSAATPTGTSTTSPPLTELEEETATQLVANNCLTCHSEHMLIQQRLSAKQWESSIKKMQGWGALIEDDDAKLILRFLSARYVTGAPQYEPRAVDPRVVAQALTPKPDGRYRAAVPEKGQTLYAEQCASCHGPDARGGEIGTNLVDRPLLYRAETFAAIVRQGRARMPAYPDLRDGEIGALLAHLRRLRP